MQKTSIFGQANFGQFLAKIAKSGNFSKKSFINFSKLFETHIKLKKNQFIRIRILSNGRTNRVIQMVYKLIVDRLKMIAFVGENLHFITNMVMALWVVDWSFL